VKPFRFALQGRAVEPQAWRDTARRAEDLGYSTLYVPDHFDVDSAWSPIVALTVAAETTSTLEVGSLVLGNDYRHPAIAAKEFATLALASGGRAVFGLGAGWLRTDYEELGLPYDEPAVRVDRLAEAIAVAKGCFSPGPFTFEGEHYSITNYDAKPDLERVPPILIGGGGRRVLSLAAREADIVGINPNLRAGAIGVDAAHSGMRAETDQKVAWVREAAGERIDEIELQIRYFLAAVTDDKHGLAASVAPMFEVDPEEALDSGVALAGTVDDICDQLVERRERWGVSNVVFGADQADEFAPVVSRLAGT